MLVGAKVILLVEGNTVGKHLHPYIESITLSVHTCMYTMVTDSSTKRWTFTLSKFDEPFGVRFHFWKIFGNRYRSVWRSYSWLNMTRLYTPHVEFETLWGSHVYIHDGYERTNKKIGSHTTKIRRAFRRLVPFWKIFGNRCRLMWGSYFWLRMTSRIHPI